MLLVFSSPLQLAENPRITFQQGSEDTLTTLWIYRSVWRTSSQEWRRVWSTWLFHEIKVIESMLLPVCPVHDTAVHAWALSKGRVVCVREMQLHTWRQSCETISVLLLVTWNISCLVSRLAIFKSAKLLWPLCPAWLWNNGFGCMCRMQIRHGAPAWWALLNWV